MRQRHASCRLELDPAPPSRKSCGFPRKADTKLFDECTPDPRAFGDDPEELGRIISAYLYTQSKEMRQVFVRRYFHSESIIDIAERFEMTESKVKSILHRMRLGLKTYLGEHEIHI